MRAWLFILLVKRHELLVTLPRVFPNATPIRAWLDAARLASLPRKQRATYMTTANIAQSSSSPQANHTPVHPQPESRAEKPIGVGASQSTKVAQVRCFIKQSCHLHSRTMRSCSNAWIMSYMLCWMPSKRGTCAPPRLRKRWRWRQTKFIHCSCMKNLPSFKFMVQQRSTTCKVRSMLWLGRYPHCSYYAANEPIRFRLRCNKCNAQVAFKPLRDAKTKIKKPGWWRLNHHICRVKHEEGCPENPTAERRPAEFQHLYDALTPEQQTDLLTVFNNHRRHRRGSKLPR